MVSGQDLRYTSVAYTQLSGYVTGTDAQAGQLHDPHARGIWKRSSVDEDASQLIHFAVLRTLRLWNDKWGKILARVQ